jgi:glycine dehydrogenase subunit 1
MRFAPHTDGDVREMLDALGLSSVEELFAQIPPEVRLGRELDLPLGPSEMELVADLRGLAAKNRHVDELVSFAGGGAYDHYVPAVVWALAGRSELYTSYTPYQPEVSQGILQGLFEYQSMIAELTALEVSNASLYDGVTALVEAVNMARAATRRQRVLVSEAVDPRYWATLRTYGRGSGYQPEPLEAAGGVTTRSPIDGDVAAVVVQHPNVFGNLEPAEGLFADARAAGARSVQVFDPLSLGVLAPPGQVGADIAVAEGQSLGNHLAYGGPYLGIIAARMQDVRRLPGRIVGETVDVDGEPGYVLTLQAREQHIRREKASSNICTNQTLMAIAAAIYLGWLGPRGLEELGRQSHAKAVYASERLGAVGAELAFADAPFFSEFALRTQDDPSAVQRRLLGAGFLVGPVCEVGPRGRDGRVLLIAVTERRSRDEIDAFVKAFEEAQG